MVVPAKDVEELVLGHNRRKACSSFIHSLFLTPLSLDLVFVEGFKVTLGFEFVLQVEAVDLVPRFLTFKISEF